MSVVHAVRDGPDNLILVYLRRVDEKTDRLTEADLGRRVTSLEGKVALLHGDLRLDRIERRPTIAPT